MAWQLDPQMYRETAQSLQEGRKMARSIETLALSLMPLCDNEENDQLDLVRESAIAIAIRLSGLYGGIAARAFGPQRTPGRPS